MFKKLLVAVLALTIIVGMFSPAMATKNPNEAKKIWQSLPPGTMRDFANQNAIDDRPQQNPPAQMATKTATPPGLVPYREAAPCTDQYYAGALAYYWDGVPGAATVFTAAGCCTVKTFTLDIYSGGATPAAAGITVYIWNNDGFGLPGSVVSSVSVPHASIVYYPSALTINFAPANIVFCNTDYLAGYIENNFTDSYRPLSDDGTTGVDRSRYYDNVTAAWMTMIVATGTDYNWSMTLNSCCGTGGGPSSGCESHVYDNGVYYRWTDRLPRGVRFTATNQCTLITASFNISSGGQVGTGGVDVSVYSDVAGLPGALLGTKHVAHGSIIIPGLNTVNMQSLGLVFNNTDYHIVYSITNPVTDDYEIRSDDGTGGNGRSTIDTTGAGNWASGAILFAPDDYNWMISDSTCCSTAPPICWTESYAGAATYYWPIPDAYGDDFFNMRFTNATKCTLKTVNLAFYQAGSVGTPGATIYLWHSDGTFPTTVINSFPVPTVSSWFPAYTTVNVAGPAQIFAGEYHVGYTPIYNNPSDKLAILSDDGSTATGRGSENYAGVWGLMLNDWGVDAAFLISVDKCCQPVGYCDWVCDPNDQWPIFAHDYARTSQSGIKLGDLCGIRNRWVYDPGVVKNMNFNAPVIANDRVYVAYDDRVICINLFDGIEVWNTKVAPLAAQYALLINNNLRSYMTVEGGALYFGTGSLKGFVKADAANGNVIWARSSTTGNALPGAPGNTRYAPSVIMGNEIYFGDENGQIYALDKTTGLDLYMSQLYYDYPGTTSKAVVYGSPSTDGTHLFFGIAKGFVTGGGVFSVTPGGAFAINWYFVDPFQGTLGTGFVAAPSFRCDNLFVNSYSGVDNGGYKGYRQNLDPLTGALKWPDYYKMGQAWSAPVATIGGMNPLAVFANMNNGGSGSINSRAVRAVTFTNTTQWINQGTPSTYDNNLFVAASVTCDPYVLYGTADQLNGDGHWRIADGNLGTIMVDYYFTGFVMGTAIAHGSNDSDYVVVSVRSTGYGTGAGKVFAFLDMGPRPRMIIPELEVTFEATNTSDPMVVSRTDGHAIENIGCQSLNFTATLAGGNPPVSRRISSVSPSLAKRANSLANRLVDYRVEDMAAPARIGAGKFAGSMQLDDAGELAVSTIAAVKPAPANSSKLAAPGWVSWNYPVGGVGAVGPNSFIDFTFDCNRGGMALLGQNYWYVDIVSDDPDFNVEDPSAVPQAEILYHLPYVYCPVDTGRMAFGTAGGEWYSNRGEFGDGLVSFDFTLDGASDGAYLYEGSIFFMTSMNTAAWNPFGSIVPQDFGYLYPFYVTGTTCGSCIKGLPLPTVEYTTTNGATYFNPLGDICSFAVIDSMQDGGFWPHQTGPSMGILVKYREIGTYGADFSAFKLVVMDIINRNGTAINGLYYGMFTDWDVASGANNGNGNIDKSYIYLFEGGEAYGNIGLPLKGSYLGDGITKALPAYNARINDNATEIYPPKNWALDSLYAWIDSRPQGALTYAPAAGGPSGTPSDQSFEIALGKVDLAGSATHSFGFAVFGFAASGSINADVENLSKFVNKYAGFDRGDINGDGVIDLRDLVRLQKFNAGTGNGPVPFKHIGDVNNDGAVDGLDCDYMAAYFFTGGTGPKGAFKF